MKTTVSRSKLLSTILLGVALTAGCSSFKSPSSEYVKPGDLCVDVSDLPDPNEPAKKKDETAIRNIANQYGAAGRQESPERLLLQAESYFEQGRYHDSARLYKKYLNTPAASSATTDQLALIHYRIGFVADKKMFYPEARDEFAKALQLAPTNLDYLFAHAKACYDAQDYATADSQFTALLSRAPSHRDALYYYGLTLLEGANRAQAIAPLTSSVGALEARALLADKYYALGDLPNAYAVENETVQLAAQLGKPIPELPHKAKILASAQNNAVYAQNVAVDISTRPEATTSAAPTNPQPAFVAQAPDQIVPLPTETPTPTPVVQPANDAPQTEVAKPRFAQIGPAAVQPTPAPTNAQENLPAPKLTNSTIPTAPAQPVAPVNPAPVSATSSLTNVEQPLPQQPGLAPQVAPTTTNLSAAPTFESVEPTAQQAPVETPQVADVDAPLPPLEPFPDFDDDDWGDSAFATSGGTENIEATPQIAPQQAPVQQVPVQVAPQQVVPQSVAPQQAIPLQPASTQNIGVPQQPSSYRYAPISPRYASKGKRRGVISTSYVAPKIVRNAARRFEEDVEETNSAVDAQEEVSENNGVFALVVRGEIAESDVPTPLARAEAPTFRVDAPVSDASVSLPKENRGKIRSVANFGPSNPGFFAVSNAAQDAERRLPLFKPGSINDDANVEQNVPDEVAAQIVASQTRAPRFVAEAQVMPPVADRLDQYADDLEELDDFDDLDLAPQRFAIRRLSPADALQVFDRLEELMDMEDDYLASPDDEFAFATSGAPYADAVQTPVVQPAPSRAPVGFGDYSAPEYVALSLPEAPAGQPVAQPVVAQPVAPNNPPARGVVPQAQTIPQTAAPRPVQPAAPAQQSARSNMTPEEKLQAARNAGAQIMELTPEQYRAAVSKGLGGN